MEPDKKFVAVKVGKEVTGFSEYIGKTEGVAKFVEFVEAPRSASR